MVAIGRSNSTDTHRSSSTLKVAKPRKRLSRYTPRKRRTGTLTMELWCNTNSTRIVHYPGLEDPLIIRELWCAVIEQAFMDSKLSDKQLKCNSKQAEALLQYEDAIRFFKSNDFVTICECLKIEHEPIKIAVLK